ncbi:hypothetical protein EKG37_17530 [Robertmurraya yapensis]|uniref:Fibronectin type-III domain-containing protein n=2 Tax=Bacillaceae TaxID=186817 RepID=A0A3S0I947_9BACI|nr:MULTISPECIES: LamG-like jellyroll fold domain-containing protein [Bacillaceae]RTR28105.1 hypothetical protein EKG37_17530 [Bacillus yapensis]TKC15174.1 hypothetical protein FA727_20040 [Robertmurraya kyonggiensis]TKS94347.1 hypothetical protein FAR12_17530 [Bacillus yapensis]
MKKLSVLVLLFSILVPNFHIAQAAEITPPASSLQFSGNEGVTVNNINSNQTTGAKSTIEAWVKWNGGNATYLVFGFDTSYGVIFHKTGYFGINTGQGEIIGVPSSNLAGRWLHIAVVLPNAKPTAQNAKIYINGVLQTLNLYKSDGRDSIQRSVSKNLFIGENHNPNYAYPFNGQISQVRFWNGERTQKKITDLANSVLNGNEANLLGYWIFDNLTTKYSYDQTSYQNNAVVNGNYATPLSLTATAITDMGMNLNWNAVSRATNYELVNGEQKVYEGPNLSFHDQNLQSETNYSYKVIAKNDNGESLPLTKSFTTAKGELAILQVPTNISFNPITLNGEIQKSFGTFSQSIIIKDTRKTRNGWKLMVSATSLKSSDGLKTFPKEKIAMKPVATISQKSGLVATKPTVINNTQIIDSTAKKLVSANTNTGYGVFEINLPSQALELTLNPENSYVNSNGSALSYFTDLTWSIEEGA